MFGGRFLIALLFKINIFSLLSLLKVFGLIIVMKLLLVCKNFRFFKLWKVFFLRIFKELWLIWSCLRSLRLLNVLVFMFVILLNLRCIERVLVSLEKSFVWSIVKLLFNKFKWKGRDGGILIWDNLLIFFFL